MKPTIGMNLDYREKEDGGTHRIKSSYVDAVFEASGIPLPVPSVCEARILKEYASRCDGFVFIGGRDYSPELYGEASSPETKLLPERRQKSDLLLARILLETDKPVLGICAGLQLICISMGGKLIQHIDGHSSLEGDLSHEIEIDPRSKILKRIFGTGRIAVNSSHHQAVNPLFPGKGLIVSARSPCDDAVEAVESDTERFILGVQWHPERIADAAHRKRLFSYFVRRCSRNAGK